MAIKLSENLNCEEIKEVLIEQIRNLNCETLTLVSEKKMNFNPEFIYRQSNWLFEHPIPKKDKENQVLNAKKYFGLFPEKFIIKKLNDTISLYKKTKAFMYTYFLYDGNNVNIAFLFKDEFYLGEEFIINNGDELYLLKNEELVHCDPNDYNDVKTSIVNFGNFFNQNYSDFKMTKYIIFTMDLIDVNFNGFDDITEVFVGALSYSTIYRPNLISKINEIYLVSKNPAYEPDLGSYYFNMGHMYP